MSRTLLRGKKFSDSHQTIIDPARDILNFLKNLDTVKKIVIGVVKNQKSKHPSVKCRKTSTSLEMIVKGHGEIQQFYVLGNDLNKIERDIITNFH